MFGLGLKKILLGLLQNQQQLSKEQLIQFQQTLIDQQLQYKEVVELVTVQSRDALVQVLEGMRLALAEVVRATRTVVAARVAENKEATDAAHTLAILGMQEQQVVPTDGPGSNVQQEPDLPDDLLDQPVGAAVGLHEVDLVGGPPDGQLDDEEVTEN